MSQPPITCRVHESLNEAARQMWEHDCGALPVVDDDGKVVGIVTDRDVCMAAYTQGQRLDAIPVESAMAKQVACCHPDETIEAAEELMKGLQVRRLPVVDGDGHPLGVLSLNDLAQEVVRPRSIGNGIQRGFLATVGAICRPRSPQIQESTPVAMSVAKPPVQLEVAAG
jgi:predicted transcriptional regulator